MIWDSTNSNQDGGGVARDAAFNTLILRTAMAFINLPLEEMDGAISQALADIGSFFGADRVYVFTYDFSLNQTRNTHEWCAPGISPQIDQLQAVDLDEIVPFWEPHYRGEPVLVPDVAALEPGSLKDILSMQHIKSLLSIPLMNGEECIGFVGFDAVKEPITYGYYEVEMLKLFAVLLVNMQLRKSTDDALQKKSTELANINKQLQMLAHYDTITRLPNRILLADRLQLSMRQVERRRLMIAIVYLDMDGFKAINDQHGHDVGDQMLAGLAGQMQLKLREGDTLARLGGDEFVAVLIDLPDTGAVDPIISRLLEAAGSPIDVNQLQLQVSASAGVTFYPQSQPIDADQLLRQADQAMYQAKMAGRNQYRLFDTAREKVLKAQQDLINEVRNALKNDQFRLYYQPKVNMRTGEVIGAEALIRWQHPKHGLLLPGYFLPCLQDDRLSIELDDWVLAQAVNQVEQWQQAGLSLTIGVNLSAMQIQQADFIDKLRPRLSQCKAGSIELEIVESSALGDIQHVSDIITTCDELGARVALDDFGTGYSSLTYLRRLPAQVLKIDRSFVSDMLGNDDDLAMLRAIIGLASAFRCEVVAEGVETTEQGECLLDLGCDMAQGFGIARPMTAESIIPWIDSWQPAPSWLARNR
ncbi:MAG: EAL domain-containing protein [Halomonas sp.]|uniref:bifunctional diguanylate cyclase/phosphodiesterase n=1 Tax=Halomonas sp. TaxID=1486246 RepID=UPI002ACDA7B3|nr:EAL domain-containing protein [Halomonas sp.]MDZ7852080.1 EAL domain-containing protein [Halomonas sp.]